MQGSAALRFSMPEDRCCNCDSRIQLSMLPMAFPLASRGLPDAGRWWLVLRAPFCPACARSSRRRPLRRVESLLLGLLLFVLLTVGLAPAARSAGLHPMLTIALAALAGFGLPFAVARWMPREHGQSSFWRPLRVAISRGEALKGVIGSLRLEFTSAPFARAFEARNQEVLQQGALSVRVVR